jgi:sugar lactone lactonase YvrE
MNRFALLLSLSLVWTKVSQANKIRDFYEIENVQLPDLLIQRYGNSQGGQGRQADGLDFMPDGRLVACFVGGEVFTLSPKTGKWKLFADGMHTPLGVVALSDREVIVSQRPELTRLKDSDGDGVADEYSVFSDDFGLSGNYHEFHFGPVRDKDGNFYVSLGTASSGADVRFEKRGKFDKSSYLQRMYASVPYRGWVCQVTKDGRFIPWASGLRTPNGLGFDLDGNLFVSDNQGDWVGTSKLHHIEKGKFYGHAASLIWKDDWKEGRPVDLPVPSLDAMRETAAILFPHGSMSNSPTQPLVDSTDGKFGPFSGQMLIGEMNKPRIMRVITEKVGGKIQGACLPFYDGNGLATGNNRLTFGPDGKTLWVAHSAHGWAGSRGIQKIKWNGKLPPELLSIKLTTKGFSMAFTVPMDAESVTKPDNFLTKVYAYKYHQGYGSPQISKETLKPEKVTLSSDAKTIRLEYKQMTARRVYEFNLGAVLTADGGKLVNSMVAYHAHNLRQ